MNSSAPEGHPSESTVHAPARIQPVSTTGHHTHEEATLEGGHGNHPDPITGEPHSHPVGVGVGAFSAGAAGAAIGAIAGPLGALIGAAIGAVTGGLAGKEVATHSEDTTSAEGKYLGEEDMVAPDGHVVAVHTAMTSPVASEFNASLHGDPVIGTGHQPSPYMPVASVDHMVETQLAIGHSHEASVTEAKPATGLEHTSAQVESHQPAPVAAEVGTSFASSDRDAAFGINPAPLPEAHDHATQAHAEDYTLSAPSEEHVREAAYYRYLDRQHTGRLGDELGDWIEAENGGL